MYRLLTLLVFSVCTIKNYENDCYAIFTFDKVNFIIEFIRRGERIIQRFVSAKIIILQLL